MKVGELRKMLETMPDDAKIEATFDSIERKVAGVHYTENRLIFRTYKRKK